VITGAFIFALALGRGASAKIGPLTVTTDAAGKSVAESQAKLAELREDIQSAYDKHDLERLPEIVAEFDKITGRLAIAHRALNDQRHRLNQIHSATYNYTPDYTYADYIADYPPSSAYDPPDYYSYTPSSNYGEPNQIKATPKPQATPQLEPK
jgi:hypothetical protein